MNLLKTYIISFLKKSGNYIFFSTIISRLLSFLTSWILIQFIDNHKLGVLLYAWNIITFITPFIGFGLPQSFLRYGALLKSKKDKTELLQYVVKYGTFSTLILSFLVSFISFIIPFKFEKTFFYLALLSVSFVPFFWLQILKIQFRLEHDNKKFAVIDFLYSLFLLIFTLILSYYYKEMGYIISLIITPTIISLIFIQKLRKRYKNILKPTIIDLEFWKFGFFGSLSNVSSMLLLAIDILLIGNLLIDSESVTVYRYISLVPLSILFLPRVFINTDFVTLTENIKNKKYIFNYIKSYILFFILISFLYLGFSYLFSKTILSFFDENFTKYTASFFILNIGVCGILIFRGLFGNLLSSIGKVKFNYYLNLFALLLNIISNYILIPKYGIKGAAITSSFLMWFTGIGSLICFFTLYKNYVNTTSPLPD